MPYLVTAASVKLSVECAPECAIQADTLCRSYNWHLLFFFSYFISNYIDEWSFSSKTMQ